MKESLGLYILLLAAWTILSTCWYTCEIRNRCISEAFEDTEELLSAGNSSFDLKITDTRIVVVENTKFIHSHHIPIISGPVKLAFNRIQTYLLDHDDLAIEVTGAYTPMEKNHSLLSNLGLARAEAFKAWMVEQGIKRNQIITSQISTDTLTFAHDTVLSALAFKMRDLPEEKIVNKEELKEIAARLKNNYRPFYFESSSTKLFINQDLRNYVQDLKVYLDANPDHIITLVGYTDESGDAETNVRIGRMRAEYVRQKLSQAGIDDQQIRTNSKGASAPAADHDTKKSNQNRRVEIQFN